MSVLLPEIRARSLPEANDDIIRLGHRAAVVSIGEPGSPTPYGFKDMSPLHLRLEFHDIVEPVIVDTGSMLASLRTFQPPSETDVQRLLDHAPILRTAELVYCHCNAGISRSTAVAYVLRCLWLGPGKESEALAAVFEDRPIADPNRLLVTHADRLMGRGGAMVAALASR